MASCASVFLYLCILGSCLASVCHGLSNSDHDRGSSHQIRFLQHHLDTDRFLTSFGKVIIYFLIFLAVVIPLLTLTVSGPMMLAQGIKGGNNFGALLPSLASGKSAVSFVCLTHNIVSHKIHGKLELRDLGWTRPTRKWAILRYLPFRMDSTSYKLRFSFASLGLEKSKSGTYQQCRIGWVRMRKICFARSNVFLWASTLIAI